MKYIPTLAFILALVWIAQLVPSLANGLPDSDAIQENLSKFGEPVELLAPADVDQSSCGDVGPTPGFVSADLNDDGFADYAAILKFTKPKKAITWEGNTYYMIELRLVAFMGRADGMFDMVELEKTEDTIPAINWIKLLPPGTVIARPNESPLLIRTAAVKFIYCEKSSFVTWWETGSFKRYWTSD